MSGDHPHRQTIAALTPGPPEPVELVPNLAGVGGVSGVMGGMDEFDSLFRTEYLRLVRALAISFTSSVAEVAVADAFAVAHRQWPRVSQLDDPAGWIRRVAINKAISARRTVLRRRQREQLVPTVVARTELSDDLIDLAAAIAALPQKQRLIFSLRYLADMSVADIGEVLAISTGTVKSTLYGVRAKLTKEVRDD